MPAGLEHDTHLKGDVTTLSVLFEPALIPWVCRPGPHLGGVAAHAGDARLLVALAVRRHRRRAEVGEILPTLADLVADALAAETPLLLPTSDDPLVAAAMRYTRDHLATVTIEDVSRAVSVSERTLRRMFTASVAMSWRDYLTSAHAAGDDAARDARADCELDGHGSRLRQPGSFTRAFTQFSGETPSSYRSRVRQGLSSRAEVCALIGHSLPRAGAESLQCSRD